MIKYCFEKWDKNKEKLRENLINDSSIASCNYFHLLEKVVTFILNDGENNKEWFEDSITEINNGDYQGTLLFLIPKFTEQPEEYQYLMTFVNYGSCSGCDTLMSLQDDELAEIIDNIDGYMSLCEHLVCNMIKPYNYGWRNDPDFDTVEQE